MLLTTREEVHRLVDELSDGQLLAAARALRRLRAKDRRLSLAEILANAPYDDEPESAEEKAAIAEAREDIRAGRVLTDEELARELGLPPLDDDE